jgi:hypothetical protein
MISQDIFPVDDSGATPHTDPRTQTIEQITQDGVAYWRVTNYTVQELQGVEPNTDTEWYVDFYTGQVNAITKKVTAIKADATYYDSLTSGQKTEIDAYQTQVSAIPTTEEFPVGVVFPNIPVSVSTYNPGLRMLP